MDGQGCPIYRREEAGYDFDILRYSLCYVIHQTLFVRKLVHDRIGFYRHKDFLNCCDYEFILRLGRQDCRVGHVPRPVINYRCHEHGQSADSRVTHNMQREAAIICREYGQPVRWRRPVYRAAFRLKRQW